MKQTIRFTIEEIEEKLKKCKYPLLFIDSIYINNVTKHNFKCENHGIFKKNLSYIIHKTDGCSFCRDEDLKKKCRIERIKKLENKEKGITIVEIFNYVKNNKEGDGIFNCKKHGNFVFSYAHSIHKDLICSMCSKNRIKAPLGIGIEKAKKIAEEGTECKMISTEYKDMNTKYVFSCPEHGLFTMTLHNFLRKKRCQICAKEYVGSRLKNSYEHVVNWVKDNTSYEFLDAVYINSKSKHNFLCKEHGVFQHDMNSIKRGIKCPKCWVYKGEEECRSIFENIFSKKFITIRPDWLKNPETRFNLELDGYCEELNLSFEHDGLQHYKSLDRMGGEKAFESIQKRDALKTILCKNNGICLIRIPYFIKNKEEFILSELKKNGFEIFPL